PPVGGSIVTQAGGGVVIQGNGNVVVSQSYGTVTGSVTGVTITSGGSVVVGGAVGGIAVEVCVPTGQTVEIDTDTGNVTTTGRLASARVETGSGRVQLAEADVADVAT